MSAYTSVTTTPMIPKPLDKPPALDLLVEAMMLIGCINANAGEFYRNAFKVALAAAPCLLDGQQTARTLKAYQDRLDRHIAMRNDGAIGKPAEISNA